MRKLTFTEELINKLCLILETSHNFANPADGILWGKKRIEEEINKVKVIRR